MALENIDESFTIPILHKNVAVTNNAITTIVACVAGQRVKVLSIAISSDTASKFTLRSGNSETIFDFHSGANWGSITHAPNKFPLYVTNVGDALTIQSNDISLDANVYVQYTQSADN